MAKNAMPSKRSRPPMVTVLAILMALLAVLLLVVAGLFGFGSALLGVLGRGVLGVASGVVALIFVVIAGLYFATAYGFFNGSSWAWYLAMILSIIGIVLGLFSITRGNLGGIVTLIINAAIALYLLKPATKNWFLV